MSIALMTEVWRLDMAPTDKMVLLALADAANDDGVTWMAVKSRKGDKLDLLTKCSLSERGVQGALKRLVEGGYLTRMDRPGRGVIWTVHPRTSCAPQIVPPAANDTDPRTSCGETVSNHHTSEANASSVGVRAMADIIALLVVEWKRTEAARKPRPSKRCPLDWMPSPADVAVAVAEGFSPGEIERELASIRDCEFAKPRTDWSATYRNWFRREAKTKARHVRPANDHKLTAKSDNLARGWAATDGAAAILADRRALR
jgi:hypothetical protein